MNYRSLIVSTRRMLDRLEGPPTEAEMRAAIASARVQIQALARAQAELDALVAANPTPALAVIREWMSEASDLTAAAKK